MVELLLSPVAFASVALKVACVSFLSVAQLASPLPAKRTQPRQEPVGIDADMHRSSGLHGSVNGAR